MRLINYFLLIFLLSSVAFSQSRELTDEQLAEKRRYELAKKHFLNEEYLLVLDYYDSILSERHYTKLETYKMANESSINLSKLNKEDSISYLQISEEAYLEAIKWYGKMNVEEKWPTIEITRNEDPPLFKKFDEEPTYPGGLTTFYRYISEEMRYPDQALQMGIEGKVYVQFIVNKDGSIDAVNVVKGIGSGCDEEAIRVVKNAPNFIPGKTNGEPVYVKMILPIIFKLTPTKNKKRKG